jgi:lipopolysaccharide assembly outer membrane protein LptD (OstA)
VRWALALLGVLAILMAASPAGAQRLPRPNIQTPRRDTTHRDTTAADSAMAARLRLSPPDSLMQALMRRPGYNTTRYEGERVTFDAQNDLFQILALQGKRAIVQRGDSQTVFADTGVFFNQRTKVATATGNIVLHDPTSGQADVVGRGRREYSLNQRAAMITNPIFAANLGEVWEIRAQKGKSIFGDSTAGRGSAFYGLGGEITSCTDSVPDYHFTFKEIKRTGSNTLVARPAVLYIKDIPVMWLPFLFSDTRPGRHSGILTPRFGISDFIRTSPSYRRNVENLGYFLSINDYMDASAWIDWRSSAGATQGDPGWIKYNGEWRYSWMDRFLTGSLASSYTRQRDGLTNLALTWGHNQAFTRDRRFNAQVNYVTSTTLQRQNTYNPYAALATIRSSLTYSDKIGPAQLQLGGTRTQYPGRSQVDENLPSLSINTGTLSLANWLQWTPNFSYNATQTLHIDQPGEFAYRYLTGPNNSLDSVRTKRDQYTSSATFNTPITIFGYNLANSFQINEKLFDYPQRIVRYDVNTGATLGDRIYPNLYETDIDWTPNFTLPALARSLFNITPGVGLQNATSGPFWVRTNLSNGQFVHQTKRPSFSLSAAPVIYGLWPGFGPFSRLRHTLQPTISYMYAPPANVSTDYLQALGRSKGHEFAGLQMNALSFGLNQNIEAKIRTPNDTNPEGGEKIKLLSLTVSSFSYNIDQAHAAHRAIRGLTTPTLTYSVTSDLLPGFNFSSSYSLFSGDPQSDTARFSPYLTQVSASLNLGQGNNPFTVLTRLFGRAVPNDQRPTATPTPDQATQPEDAYARQLANQPVAGSGARGTQFVIPPTQGWNASLTFSSTQTRPPTGSLANVVLVDPLARCRQLAALANNDPFVYQTCAVNAQTSTTATNQDLNQTGIAGTTFYRNPPVRNLGGNVSFALTENWSVTWNTSFDFVKHEFAEHMVTLQRDLHDWRAVFAFTQSPNGNFAFNFFIALKAEPDLKFDYNKATVRSGSF